MRTPIDIFSFVPRTVSFRRVWIRAVSYCVLSGSFVLSAPSQGETALDGVAGIISAASPIVETGIRASANEAIAAVNAGAAVEMTRISAETSKYLSTAQTEIALAQTQAAVNINAMNQQGATDRLAMQLAELRSARQQQFALDRERMRIERELNDARIDLAYKQAEANLKLAQMTLQAQLVQAGLSTGFTRRDSSASLTVNRALLGGSEAGQAVAGSAGSPEVARGGMATRLLASVDGAEENRFTSLRSARRALARTAEAGALVSSLSRNSVARGSRPGYPIRLQTPASAIPQSDLASFRRSAPSYGDALAVHARPRDSVLRSESGHSARGVTGRPVAGAPSNRPRLP